jgi:SAM-dependent methyltransferase
MTKKRSYQADFYSSFAPIRARDKRIKHAKKIAWVLQRYVFRNLLHDICIDIGCSSGVITAHLSPMFKATIGVDYDRTGLAAIHPQDKSKADFVRADALHLPFASESIEVAICAQVYEHVPDDIAMMEEIYRVLRPHGYCFFSGPNWLFPIEPHYFLPFLHWMPEVWANRYLRLSGLGIHYYERLRTIWGVRHLLRQFEIKDITVDVLLNFYLAERHKSIRFLGLMPSFFWKLASPLFPNFNWILRKPK